MAGPPVLTSVLSADVERLLAVGSNEELQDGYFAFFLKKSFTFLPP